MSKRNSSGKYRSKHPFNPVQIKDGMIVRLRKDGTVKAVLGKYGEYNKQNKTN
jgi:GTP cyclohydrolase II